MTGENGESLPTEAGRGQLAPGLYFIATPIGNARDITLRALDLLRDADLLAAEDTRSLRHLMDIHGIALNGRPLISYHDHNGTAQRPRLMRALSDGLAVVYASEAGTPLVADPGFRLGQEAIAQGHPVTAAPGPSAPLAALSVSGLPSDRFMFVGFGPNTRNARQTWLSGLKDIPATLIFFESPKRVQEMLADMALVLGPDRQAALCRELTKRFEEARRGTLAELAEGCIADPPRGEIVLVVDRPSAVVVDDDTILTALEERLNRMSRKDAAAEVAKLFGLPKRQVYQLSLDGRD